MCRLLSRKSLIPSFFLVAIAFLPIRAEENQLSGSAPVSIPLSIGSRGGEIRRLWDAGDRRQAKKMLRLWMKEQKKSGEPWVMAGILKFEKKKYKACLSLCRKALNKSPQLSEAFYWRGRSYDALSKYLEAANEYRAAIMAGNGSFAEAQSRLEGAEALLAGGVSSPK